jgi:PAS domain S-box-containing protein
MAMHAQMEYTLLLSGFFCVSAAAICLYLFLLWKKSKLWISDLEAKIQSRTTELRQSEELFDFILQRTGTGIWEWNMRSGEMSVNESWAAISGFTMEELQPMSVGKMLDFCHPDDAAAVNMLFDTEAGSETEICKGKFRIRHKDGRWIWVEDLRKIAERDSSGKPLRMIGTHGDIPEQEIVEDVLKESEQKYRSIYSSFIDLYYRTAMDGTLTMLSPSAIDMTGYRPEELIGLNVVDLYVEPTRRQELQALLMKNGTVKDFETVLLKKGKKEAVVSIMSHVVKDERGRALYIEGTIRDITNRKKADENMMQLVREQQTILETTTVGICYIRERKLVWANRYLDTLFGYSVGESKGEAVRVIYLNPDLSTHLWKSSLDHFSRGENYSTETVLKKKDGSVFWCSLLGQPVDKDVLEKGAIWIVQDISERKAAEERAAEASERISQQNKIIAAFAVSPAVANGDIEAVSRLVTDFVAGDFGIERVSVWFFDDSESELRCIDLYEMNSETNSGNHSSGIVLKEEQFKNEFDFLKTAKYIDAHDALSDPRTKGYVEGYIKPKHITSMLDSAIRIGDKNLGVLCFEIVDRPHHWEQDEISFICQLADQIGIAELNRARKDAEQTLKESESRYRSFFEKNIAVMLLIDPKTGSIIDANPSAVAFYGWPHDVLVRKNINEIDIMRPDELRTELNSAADERKNFFTVKHVLADGSVRDMEVYSTPVRSHQETILCVIFHDVTNRKKAEAQTVDAMNYVQTIFDSAPFGLATFHSSGTVLSINEAMAAAVGEKLEDLKCRDFRNWKFSPKEEFIEFAEKALSLGEVQKGELSNIPESKNTRHVFVHFVPFQFKNERHLLFVAEDTTEQKAAEEKLRDTAERVHMLWQSIEKSPASVIITDCRGSIQYVNPKFIELSGYTSQEVLGKNPRILKSGLMSAKIYQELWSTILSGESWRGEFSNRKKDGSMYWESAIISPVQNEQGKIIRFLAIKEDITEHKRMENELLLAKEAAESANRAKGEFLANMSHEIRTPMNGVIGMCDLLLDTDLNSHQRHYARMVHESGESLLSLINNILDFSKIEAGKIELETVDFNICDLLDDIVDLFAFRAQEKELGYVIDLAPDVPRFLNGDPGRLRQVLINLVGNAMKFTEAGEVVLQVRINGETDENVTLSFSVRDTGIGIPETKREIIFRNFSQVDASTTRHYGGTGLGLAISQELTGLMGGTITFESSLGTGSVFRFVLTLIKRPAPAAGNVPAELAGACVLIADAHTANCEMMSAWLRSWGTSVLIVHDGDAVVQMLRKDASVQKKYLALLLDTQIPGMNEGALVRRLRTDPALQHPSLILMTPYGQHLDSTWIGSLEIDRSVMKPVRPSILLDTMTKIAALVEKKDIVCPNETAEEPVAAEYSDVRILIAEDNPINQQVVIGVLKKLGYTRVDAVANGVEALQALRQMSYGAVLMDIQMPEMDGLEAVRRIRTPGSGVRNSDIPVIALTAHAMLGDREKYIAAGMNDYISKPIEREHLRAVLQRCHFQVRMEPFASDKEKEHGGGAQQPPSQEPMVKFKRTFLLDQFQGDAEAVYKIFREFIEDMPERISILRKQVEANDMQAALRQAHGIKGSSANIGADALRNAASEMEYACRAGDGKTAKQKNDILDAEFKDARAAMEEEIHRGEIFWYRRKTIGES